jgi:hypothetical protein
LQRAADFFFLSNHKIYMTHALQTTDKNIYESLALRGDLSLLKPEEKAVYLQRLCESMQLNPLTQPFIPLKLNGKEILYASRGATDQLASNHKLTREIIDTKRIDDVYIVTCKVTAPDGRFETGTGAVSLGNLKGDALANALMKAECVPLDSEILTREGWKKYNEIFEGQEVLAYDCETDSCVWTELEAITVHESLPMARLFSDKGQFEVFCTPNHSWAVSKPEYKPRPTNNFNRSA